MKEIITVDTENHDSIIDSLSRLFRTIRENVHYYIIMNHIKLTKGSYDDIDIDDFYAFIKENEKDDNYSVSTDFYVTAFHLAKRMKPILQKETLYNLHN